MIEVAWPERFWGHQYQTHVHRDYNLTTFGIDVHPEDVNLNWKYYEEHSNKGVSLSNEERAAFLNGTLYPERARWHLGKYSDVKVDLKKFSDILKQISG